MVNFKKLVKKTRDIDVADLLALFESLDRHGSHIDLRPIQKDVLSAINGRRNEKDLVLKVSTGAGKTAMAALLYLQSHMEKSGKPVVYLCPTVQLVEQVHEEAQKLGIKSVIYPAGETVSACRGNQRKSSNNLHL